MLDYLPVLIFLGIGIGLGVLFIIAAMILAVKNPDPEKVSTYECGFNAFDDSRMNLPFFSRALHDNLINVSVWGYS